MFRLIFINKVRTKTFIHQSPSAETYQIIQSFPHALVCPPRSTARVMREYAKIDLYIGLSKHSMDQSTNCVWHFWETGNHSPHESTAICNQRSWPIQWVMREDHSFSQHLWHLQGSRPVTGLQPAGPCLATNCWNTRCHHQDPRICQHFNWLAKLAPKTKGWHLLLSPVSHRHRCFGRRKGDFQKISLKEQAKINQKKHGMPIRHLRIYAAFTTTISWKIFAPGHFHIWISTCHFPTSTLMPHVCIKQG